LKGGVAASDYALMAMLPVAVEAALLFFFGLVLYQLN
jgi:hypothetical protein